MKSLLSLVCLVSVFVSGFVLRIASENKCPQKTIIDAWYCPEEDEVLVKGTDIKKSGDGGFFCKRCDGDENEVRVIKVKACERTYWVAEDCEMCEGDVSLSPGKCCNGKGKQMVEHKDHAALVDKCEVCGAHAFDAKSIQHDNDFHVTWNCQSCGMERYEGEECCGKPVTMKKIPEKISKGVCSKSGEFPHVARIEKKGYDEEDDDFEDENEDY